LIIKIDQEKTDELTSVNWPGFFSPFEIPQKPQKCRVWISLFARVYAALLKN